MTSLAFILGVMPSCSPPVPDRKDAIRRHGSGWRDVVCDVLERDFHTILYVLVRTLIPGGRRGGSEVVSHA